MPFSLFVRVVDMQPGSPQAYQNDWQTFLLASEHCTSLLHTLVHREWVQTLASER